MVDGDEFGEGGSPRFEAAWERYLVAEQRSLVARTEGILKRVLGEALPGESQEELDRWIEEDRTLAGQGMVELMDEEGETYHKHIDELDSRDASLGDPPACHGLKMRPVGSPIPNNKVPPTG
jgi:hypothetical protein